MKPRSFAVLPASGDRLPRFLNYIRQDGECWTWTRATKRGYGAARVGSRQVYAHRYFYQRLIGPIPAGLTLDHLCRNRACVNPAHLEPVTNRENILRGDGLAAINARRTECVHGHPLRGANLGVDPRTGKRWCRTCKGYRGLLEEAPVQEAIW